MFRNYCYIISSLPYINEESENFLSIKAFYEACPNYLVESEDIEILSAATILPVFLEDNKIYSSNKILLQWFKWETGLRNELARLRSQKMSKDTEQYVKRDNNGDDHSHMAIRITEIARNVYNQSNPLQAELMLNSERWKILEELEIGHYFDLEKLIIYCLKTQLLERRYKLLSKEEGIKKYQEIYGKISKEFALSNN